MRFFLRYVLAYIAGGLALLGVVAYMAYDAGFGAFTWVVVGLFAAWIFGYHGAMLWFDYRRLATLIGDIRAGKFSERLPPERVRESIRDLAVRYGGVPSLVAALLVRYVVTDDLARELAARVSTASQRAVARS